MIMAEIGNDEQLAAVADGDDVMARADAEQDRLDDEELLVEATSPATDEPGRQYTIPDVHPAP